MLWRKTKRGIKKGVKFLVVEMNSPKRELQNRETGGNPRQARIDKAVERNI